DRNVTGVQTCALPICLLEAEQDHLFDAIVLPGGPEGTLNLAANHQVIEFIKRHDKAQKYICALCSAAARVLGGNQLLKGRKYVRSEERRVGRECRDER